MHSFCAEELYSRTGNLSAEWTASSKMDRLVRKTFPLSKKFRFFGGTWQLAASQNMLHMEPYWLLGLCLSLSVRVEAIEDKHLLCLYPIDR
jgi:hypothetical protein